MPVTVEIGLCKAPPTRQVLLLLSISNTYYPHFANEETEVLRGERARPTQLGKKDGRNYPAALWDVFLQKCIPSPLMYPSFLLSFPQPIMWSPVWEEGEILRSRSQVDRGSNTSSPTYKLSRSILPGKLVLCPLLYR